MKKIRRIALIILVILNIGIIIQGYALAERSASFSVSCYMPYYVTMPNGEKALAEGEKAKTENKQSKETAEEGESSSGENEPYLIQQKEEVLSEDNEGIQIITTVCAK